MKDSLKCNRWINAITCFRLNYKNPAENNQQWFHSNEAQSNMCNTETRTMTEPANVAKIKSQVSRDILPPYILLCSSSPGGLWSKVPTKESKWRGTDPGEECTAPAPLGANLLKLFYSSISSWNGVTSPHCAVLNNMLVRRTGFKHQDFSPQGLALFLGFFGDSPGWKFIFKCGVK